MAALPLSRISRRHLLSLATATALSAVAPPIRRLTAQVTPVATPLAGLPTTGTPVGGTPVAETLPLPSTLAADASPAFRAVTEALVAAMREFQIPGAALGILAGDREEHATFGVESLASLAPVTPETRFAIGSLTKSFTATAIWRLIDQGALALDAPARTYLPEFRLSDAQVAAAVTVDHLLTHTAGWYGDDFTVLSSSDDALARYVSEVLPQQPQLFPLGAFFSYNNSAFTLLGHLIEVATGTVYDAAMRDLLLEPLGLSATLLDFATVRRRPHADGHIAEDGGLVIESATDLGFQAADPAGGIWSTTQDLIRYVRFHLGTGTVGGPARVVQPDSLARMQTPAVPIPGVTIRMGRNWFIQDVAGVRVILHNGDTGGHHTEFMAIPGQDFAVVLLTNSGSGGNATGQAVLDAAFANYPGLAALAGQVGLNAQLRVPAETRTLTLPPEQLAAYAGRYADPNQRLTFTVQDGMLELIHELGPPPPASPGSEVPPAPPTPVVFVADDVAAAEGFRLPFVRDDEGAVQWVASALRLVPRVSEDADGS